MTTSGTKTRALCVATRCTTVDQFVATFHRFCGDDQSFFVATLTSRPIGLETPFSIQLADKQPVLRGLCIVLDAWATPENRYKRPGIRLGIKRLTADSQLVFARLQHASKAPGVAEATPPPGPPPLSLEPLHRTSPGPPALSLEPLHPRSPGPPPLSLEPLHPAPPSPASSLGSSHPAPPGRATVPARFSATPPPLPRVVTARRVAPPVPALATPPPIASVRAVETGAPALEPLRPAVAASPPALAIEPLASTPAPIAVTRFQVALNVAAALPPTDDIEFTPRQLPQRPRIEPRIVSDPEPEAAANESGTPAVIVDRPSDPTQRERHVVPSMVAGEITAAPADPIRTREPPAVDQRTPGSALVLPANPLHDLSDESLEGFVDCTLYEESGNFFHPLSDGGEWNDEVADPPVEPLATRPARPGTVPAMPFDTAPNLTVLSRGNSESLRVAPDDLPVEPSGVQLPEPAPSKLGPPSAEMPSAEMPSAEMRSAEMPSVGMPSAEMPSAEMPSGAPPPQAPHSSSSPFASRWPEAGSLSYPSYPTVDASQYSAHATPPPVPPPVPPQLETMRPEPVWRRWLIIGGTAVAAIVVAFVIARLVRGAPHAEPRPVASGAHVVAPPTPTPPRPTPTTTPPPPAAPQIADPSARSGSGSQPTAAAATGSRIAAPPAPGKAEPASGPVPSGDGDLSAGSTPLVGSGPCRVTVATTPAGSIVRLDDTAIGPSPLIIASTCDKHRIDVSHARYQSLTRWVTLTADKPQELDVNLPRPIHAVTVTSFPTGAELSIDGHRAGTTPTVVQMMGFATVNLTFSKAGFQSVTRKVYSKLAQDHVFVKLMR
jgi:hypothetical protein